MFESRKVSLGLPDTIYIYIYIYIHTHTQTHEANVVINEFCLCLKGKKQVFWKHHQNFHSLMKE
jgi:hypothetical protein